MIVCRCDTTASILTRVYKFPHYIKTAISYDAFSNLKETRTWHKPMVANYLDKHYDKVSTVAR